MTLSRFDIAVTDLDIEASGCPGIVLVSQIESEVCELIRTFTANGTERILVLAVDRDAASDEGIRQLFYAGVSDILVWDDLDDPGGVIAARLRHWQQVDEILQTPLVRNNLLGHSPAWRSAVRQLVEVARFTDAPVLLTGETGTGKELAARLIHTLDKRRKDHELVIVDCTTIVPELSGSELFGHEKGAFTGAVNARDGAFKLANGGTVFLDEVGELPAGLQVQLLRVLQEQTFKRVGSNIWTRSDFRLICATNRDLRVEESAGRFRRDLFYRVASWTIRLPPLRERVQDIVSLAEHFIREGRQIEEPPPIDDRVKRYLIARPYPGNVRDLRNLVNRIMTRHVGPGPITMGDIPPDERRHWAPSARHWCNAHVEQAVRRALAAGFELREIRREIDDMATRIAIADSGGNLKTAAKKLGMTERTLQSWRARHRQNTETMLQAVATEDG